MVHNFFELPPPLIVERERERERNELAESERQNMVLDDFRIPPRLTRQHRYREERQRDIDLEDLVRGIESDDEILDVTDLDLSEDSDDEYYYE